MRRVILYFGSFNPIHLGHTAVAEKARIYGNFDEVWFIVSRCSPFKELSDLASDRDRLLMAESAISSNPSFRVLDIELGMSVPSYTISTIRELLRSHSNIDFSILMGEDNIYGLEKWKEWQEIVRMCGIYIYPRDFGDRDGVLSKIDYLSDFDGVERGAFILLDDVDMIKISSTEIRQDIEGNRSYVSAEVYNYIVENSLYE